MIEDFGAGVRHMTVSRGIGASMVVAGLGLATWMQGVVSPGLVVAAVLATALVFPKARRCRTAEH